MSPRGGLAAIALASTIAGCTSAAADRAADTAVATVPSPAVTSAPAADIPVGAAPVVPASLQFTAPLVGGGTFDGASVAGRPSVFWFWAPT